MSATAPDLAPSPPPRRRRRWPWILLALVAALVVLAVAAVAWLLGTSQGARFVTGHVTRLAGDGVKLEGVEGRLGGRLSIARVEVSRPDLYARVDDLVMDTTPWSPLQGTLVVHQLTAKSVELRTASSQATAKAPASFAPPYPVLLEEGRIGEFRKGDLKAANRDADLVVRDIFLRGGGTRTRWTID